MSRKISQEEIRYLDAICDRAEKLYEDLKGEMLEKGQLRFALVSAMSAGLRLDMRGLLEARDSSFSHDVFGIWRNVNSEGGLDNFFCPRYAL